MRVTILGCGGSSGVPLIGNVWGNADPANPRNRRRRPSILVENASTTVLVDTGPDMREQLVDAGVQRLDGVLYTHAHADHVHGIDDLRAVNWLTGKPVDVYGDAETLDILGRRFDYCFKPLPPGGNVYARPVLVPHVVEGPFRVGTMDIVPFVQDHGHSSSLGFRFGRIGYSTDVVRLSDEAFAVLEGVETWIVDCVRLEPPHPVHAHWEITRGWIERLKPKRAILTHMNHLMDYDSLCRMLPPGVEPAYDGMVIEAIG
ncbi:MBL fold metallo-hydrolase [Niveispirillum irakense]|uniref:MBL fold metallo-hydrolase n=1 Tax=Niveispirillum irakense TaxID=34011 RepID=UPI000426D613|nr:MBL fold metallo-hydrolase [Niveispirillum irakense]